MSSTASLGGKQAGESSVAAAEAAAAVSESSLAFAFCSSRASSEYDDGCDGTEREGDVSDDEEDDAERVRDAALFDADESADSGLRPLLCGGVESGGGGGRESGARPRTTGSRSILSECERE